jgi:hypothetical protein
VFVYGVCETRAQGRHFIKVYYDKEIKMSCLEVGDEVISIKLFLPTHKLADLLLQAYEAQTEDFTAIGTSSWLGKSQPVSVPSTS